MLEREEINKYLKRYKDVDFEGVPMLEFSSGEQQQRVLFDWVPLITDQDLKKPVVCIKKVGDALILLFQMNQDEDGNWVKGNRPAAALRFHNVATVDNVIAWIGSIRKFLNRK